jgi:hypothetical protein
MYIRVATAVWGADLTPAQINEAWEETAAHVRLHTPPAVFGIAKDFTDRLNARLYAPGSLGSPSENPPTSPWYNRTRGAWRNGPRRVPSGMKEDGMVDEMAERHRPEGDAAGLFPHT